MSKSEDVQTLFRRFGGNASTYQEVVSRDQVAQAESKWPILGLINPTANQEAPSVRRPGVALGSQQNKRQAAVSSSSSALPQAASPLDAVQSGSVAPDAPAGMFAGLTPSRAAPSNATAKPSSLGQSVANADAHSHAHDSKEAPPAVGAVLVGSGSAQGGLFNRFKAVIRPVAVKRSPVAEPVAPAASGGGAASAAVSVGETVFTLPSPPISTSTDSHAGGGMFAALVPAPSSDLSGALGRAPIRGAHVPHMEGRESKVVPGSELQALFGRMLPPPPPAPVAKKQSKSSKRAVKW